MHLHGFTGTAEDAAAFFAAFPRLYLGLNGSVTHPSFFGGCGPCAGFCEIVDVSTCWIVVNTFGREVSALLVDLTLTQF